MLLFYIEPYSIKSDSYINSTIATTKLLKTDNKTQIIGLNIGKMQGGTTNKFKILNSSYLNHTICATCENIKK